MKIPLPLLIALIVIGGAIAYLELQKTDRPKTGESSQSIALTVIEKEKRFPKAHELARPSGYLNTRPIRLADYVGKKVVLLDFWTYSCINCQRTLPYLNAWYEKYRGSGLEIVGVHTPEFDFEKVRANVQAAINKYGITYPVVQDNDYATWSAYGNRYWPRKYLIDIDGYIVYDHIGEGAYDETEKKIQELLAERAHKLGTANIIPTDMAEPGDHEQASSDVESPEIYFGSSRNELLANGQPGVTGLQNFLFAGQPKLNRLYLDGRWQIQSEFARSQSAAARIIFRYRAAKVFMVASAPQDTIVRVLIDGKSPINPGADVQDGRFVINDSRLYQLIESFQVGEHTLELIIESPGVQVYTFTFG